MTIKAVLDLCVYTTVTIYWLYSGQSILFIFGWHLSQVSKMASNLPPFPPFDLSDKNTVGVRWQKWVRRFENLMTGMNITNAVRKMALM